MSFATKIPDHVSGIDALILFFGARRKSIYAPEVKLRAVFLVKAQAVVLNSVILNVIPNKRVANLIIFRIYCDLHDLIKTYKFIDLRYFSFLHVIFTNINEKKSLQHALIRTYWFINIWKKLPPTRFYGSTRLLGSSELLKRIVKVSKGRDEFLHNGNLKRIVLRSTLIN